MKLETISERKLKYGDWLTFKYCRLNDERKQVKIKIFFKLRFRPKKITLL